MDAIRDPESFRSDGEQWEHFNTCFPYRQNALHRHLINFTIFFLLFIQIIDKLFIIIDEK